MAEKRSKRPSSDPARDIEQLLAVAPPPPSQSVSGDVPAPSSVGRRGDSGKLSRTQRGKRGLAAQRPDRAPARQKAAIERQRAWNDLTPKQKLQVLDSRPGASKKQRAKIEAQRAKDKPALVPEVAVAAAAQEPAKANGKSKKGKK